MKILIIEDEPAAAKRLKKLIEAIDNEVEVLGMTDSIEDSIEYFNTSKEIPDLILSDIHLADGSSFEIFKKLKLGIPVVFITAYDQYAIDAFKLNSIDYLLKPVKKEELAQSIDKFKNLNKTMSSSSGNLEALMSMLKKDEFPKRLIVKYGQNIKAIPIEEIAYFYTENKIVFLKTASGDKFAVDSSLEDLEKMIDPTSFFRINRQIIVNIISIERMLAVSKSRVKLVLQPSPEFEAIVSVDRSPAFKKWLTGLDNN